MLSSSFDSLRSLNVYMSLPRHLTCLSFTLLLMMAICGAQGRIWKIRHTCITFIAKSKTGSKKKNKSHSQIKMCTCMNVWIRWKLLCVWSFSLYFFFEDMAISFFLGRASLARHLFYLAHCGSCFFGMPPFLSCSLWVMLLWHVIFPLFFSFYRDSPCPFFVIKTRERPIHIVEHFMGWMDGTVLTSFRSIARGYMVCTWILIMKAWKDFSWGSQQFDRAQCKDNQHMCVEFSCYNIIWLW